MSGLLDSKSRILDTILTLEGRKQLSSADMKIEYVSFSDSGTYYKADITSGSADATSRLYFEQCHLPQDQITFEADDSGRLRPFKNANDISIKNGQIVQYELTTPEQFVFSGSSENVTVLSGDEFASTAGALLASSIENFDKLRIIGTRDAIFEDDGFSVGNSTIEFVMTNDRPLKDATTRVAQLDQLESLFNDVRLSKLKNFKFLPPINKTSDQLGDRSNSRNTSKQQLGFYKPWGRTDKRGLSPRQLEFELAHYERLGCSRTVRFDPTSRDNTLVGQFFEVSSDTMKKLDVIDYGSYPWQGSLKRCFFVGKVLVDSNETHTFIHLFTLVFG